MKYDFVSCAVDLVSLSPLRSARASVTGDRTDTTLIETSGLKTTVDVCTLYIVHCHVMAQATEASRQRREVSESENNRHVEGTWTRVCFLQPSISSQVNTIRNVNCADEGLWIFSPQESAGERKTVSWDERWHVFL